MRKVFGITVLALSLATLPALGEDFDESRTLQARALVVRNLAGEVSIGPSADSAFHVEIRARGEDMSRDRMPIRVKENGSEAVLELRFPEGESFIYPGMGRGSSTHVRDGGWFSGWFGGGLKVSGSGRGLEMWADLVIQVPRGGALTLEHVVGDVSAAAVEGDLSLDLHSGRIDVSDVTGEVLTDTGSGRVEMSAIRGRLVADTGSGAVRLRDCEGPEIVVDTGSGSVEMEDVRSASLKVDTGSGRVNGRGLKADEAVIDTGSGGVELSFDRMGGGRFVIDTGSGGVDLDLPADASARVRAEASSGGIRVDLDGARILRDDDDEMELEIGGGAADVRIDTGSGGVRIGRS